MVAVRVVLHSKSIIDNDIPGFVREPIESVATNPFYADADLSAEQMGRLCYLSGHRPNPKTAVNGRYLLNICNERHYSVLGHSAATIYIDGISRNCTHEIIRHRWFTFSEVSQRYVDASDFKLVEHPGLKGIISLPESAGDKMLKAWEAAQEAYSDMVDYLTTCRGYTRKEARQAARSILPGGIETKIGMSGNLRAWRDFLAQRLSPHADAEIRAVAQEIYKIMKAEFPNSFIDFDSKGMITTDRLIKRAQQRRDIAFANGVSVDVILVRFSKEVDKIIEQGLWVLEEDPWIEEEGI